MLNNKGKDIINNSIRDIMHNYFNPYGYNIEYNNNLDNNTIKVLKSISHMDRNRIKK